jgi:hypothetical protein
MAEWHPAYYGSGTTIVTTHEPENPWYYIYGPTILGDETAYTQARQKMCEDITAYLNKKSPRPDWLEHMERLSEEKLTGKNGTPMQGASIEATGPMFDANPPALQWQVRKDVEAQYSRARIIDRLFGFGKGKK